MSWTITSDLKFKEPVNVAEILHFEGGHKLSLFSLKEGGVVGKDHEIIAVKSNDAKEALLAVDWHGQRKNDRSGVSLTPCSLCYHAHEACFSPYRLFYNFHTMSFCL